MFLKRLGLTQFRSYEAGSFDFKAQVTALVGPNAAGKTNVLEAITLLATGESFRAGKIEEMVGWKSEVAHVVGGIETDELRVTLTRGMVQGKKTSKRRYLINGVGKRKSDFAGILPIVIFRPEDLILVTGSPSKRRDYLDRVLSQAHKEYLRSLAAYEKSAAAAQ